jgi:hypothetical protein
MTNFLFLAPSDSVKSLTQLPIFNYLCLTPSFVNAFIFTFVGFSVKKETVLSKSKIQPHKYMLFFELALTIIDFKQKLEVRKY